MGQSEIWHDVCIRALEGFSAHVTRSAKIPDGSVEWGFISSTQEGNN